MGCVFKARQPKLNRLVALKLLPSSLTERDPAFADRFEREGQVLARLNHPSIVAVHDSGTAGDYFYLLMEYVDGVNLRQAMRAKKFTPQQALAIIQQICEALQFAHDEGILHRDVKPENILLDGKGRVKLADFGIAKLLSETDVPAAETASRGLPFTHADAPVGTPSYMAPEQRSTPGNVDHRADIYSLGVVFYELLTGELPTEKFTPPSEISGGDPRVDAIVRQALEIERGRRQQSASEVRTQVQTVADGRERQEDATPVTEASGPAPKELLIGSRLSLAAVTGACCSLLVIPLSPGVLERRQDAVFILAVGALMLASTVLGWISVGQIRRSPGKYWGLPLAVYAGMVFPILIVDVLISCALSWLGYEVLGWKGIASRILHPQFYGVLGMLSLLANVFLVRWVWRAVQPSLSQSSAAAPLKPVALLWPTLSFHAALITLACVAGLYFVPRYEAVFQDAGFSDVSLLPSLSHMTRFQFYIASVLVDTTHVWGAGLPFLLLGLHAGFFRLVRDVGGRTALRLLSGLFITALIIIVLAGYVSMQVPLMHAVAQIADSPMREDAVAQAKESWSYTPRYLSRKRLGEWIASSPSRKVHWPPEISVEHDSGIITLQGPREHVRRAATMLRVLDQPEATSIADLPGLNREPDDFAKKAFSDLMSQESFAKLPLEASLVEALRHEGVSASQLGRAFASHVFELENAHFVNQGLAFEQIVRSPGASTYYEASVPCSDQPQRPLTFRIKRTTQQIGTSSTIVELAPWLIEEAKVQSKAPSLPNDDGLK